MFGPDDIARLATAYVIMRDRIAAPQFESAWALARETASKIVGLRRALDIRLGPWAFRPGIGLLPMGFCCATSPVVTCALLQPTD